jgi:hypothetical protein
MQYHLMQKAYQGIFPHYTLDFLWYDLDLHTHYLPLMVRGRYMFYDGFCSVAHLHKFDYMYSIR